MTLSTNPQAVVPTAGATSTRGASPTRRLVTVAQRLARADDGAATAEYAIVIMAINEQERQGYRIKVQYSV